MRIQNERGAVSLLWCAILVGILSLAAMTVLMSMRYERNYFAEVWTRLMSVAGSNVQIPRPQAAEAGTSGSGVPAIRKCSINGVVTYSNVECKGESSRKLDLQDTRGFEAPKPSSPPPPQGNSATLQDKIIERAENR